MSTKNVGITGNLMFAGTMICIGQSLVFGYNLGVLNQHVNLIRDFLADCYSERRGHVVDNDSAIVQLLWSLTNWSLFVGGIVGSSLVGFLSEKFGRKYAMAAIQAFSLGGASVFLMAFLLRLPELLVIGRVITGIHFGFSGSFAALYLSEIAPLKSRGQLLILHHILKSIGLFLSSIVGMDSVFGTPRLWSYSVFMNIIPSFLCLFSIPLLYESPRHLLYVKNNRKAATLSLRHYRETDDVSDEIIEIENEIENSRRQNYSVLKVVRSKEIRTPLSIGIMLHVIQQFCGINGIFFYSVGIFTEAGIHKDYVQYAVVATNFVFVLAVIASVPLLDLVGRKKLMILPMIVMIVSLVGLTCSLNFKTISLMPYISISMIFMYVSGFSVGLGGIPTMVSAELFLQGPRAHALSIIGICLLISVLIISISFEHIQALLGDQTFILFIVLLVSFVVYVHFKVPETRNRTFEDISDDFKKNEVTTSFSVSEDTKKVDEEKNI